MARVGSPNLSTASFEASCSTRRACSRESVALHPANSAAWPPRSRLESALGDQVFESSATMAATWGSASSTSSCSSMRPATSA